MPQNPKGHEYAYKVLSPSEIKMDPLYQRPLDPKRVAKIVKDFDGDVFNEPKVSFRDGAYWCFNGQHSIAAWRQLHKGQDKSLMCKVYTGMTWIDEMEAFVKQNGISKLPASNEKLFALFNGSDPDVVAMVNGAKFAGYSVDFKPVAAKGRILAVASLFNAYHALGYDMYVDMLHAIHGAWNYDSDAVSGDMINGMCAFYRAYKNDITRASLIQKLKEVSPAEILRKAKSLHIYGTASKNCAYMIVKTYNLKRSKNKLDEGKL